MISPVHDLTCMIWFSDLIFPCISISSHVCLLAIPWQAKDVFISKYLHLLCPCFCHFMLPYQGGLHWPPYLKLHLLASLPTLTVTLLYIFSSFLYLLIYSCSFVYVFWFFVFFMFKAFPLLSVWWLEVILFQTIFLFHKHYFKFHHWLLSSSLV